MTGSGRVRQRCERQTPRSKWIKLWLLTFNAHIGYGPSPHSLGNETLLTAWQLRVVPNATEPSKGVQNEVSIKHEHCDRDRPRGRQGVTELPYTLYVYLWVLSSCWLWVLVFTLRIVYSFTSLALSSVLPSPPSPRRWNLSLASFSMFVSHKSQQSTHTHTHTSAQTEARKWYGRYETCCAIVEEFGLVSGNRRRKKWVAALGFVWGFLRLIDSVANSFLDRSDD